MALRGFFSGKPSVPKKQSSIDAYKKRESYFFDSFFLTKAATDGLVSTYSGAQATERKSISSDEDKSTSSSFIAESSGGFARNMRANLYHFKDVTDVGTLAEEEQITVAVRSDQPCIRYYKKNGSCHEKPIEGLKRLWDESVQESREPELDEILLTYFRSANKVKQVKKLGQNLFAESLFSYLRLTDKQNNQLEPHNPARQIVFLRVKGNTPEQDRFFIRLIAINDTINVNRGAGFKTREKEKITESDNMNATAQHAIRKKNKSRSVPDYAFSSIDQIYELQFNDQGQGPEFISIPSCPPIFSAYSKYMLPLSTRKRVEIRSDIPDPHVRFLGFVKDISRTSDVKYSPPSHPLKTPVLSFIPDSGSAILDIKLDSKKHSKKVKWLSEFDKKPTSDSLSRVFDDAKLIEPVTNHLTSIFEQIRVNEFPDNQTTSFGVEFKKHANESIFDAQGSFAPWVIGMLGTSQPSPAQEDIQLLCRFVKDSFDIAFKGTYTDQGQFQQWVVDFIGEDPKARVPRLTLAEKALRGDTDRGIFGNLVSWVSVPPDTIVETEEEKKVANIIRSLIQHQLKNTNFEFLHAARTLNRRIQNTRPDHDLLRLQEFKFFSSDVNQALQRMPLGSLDNSEKFILLANLANTALALDPNSIAYFYAVENFKEQTREFNKDKLTAALNELEQKNIPTAAMLQDSLEKFEKIQAEHKLHPLIVKMKEKIKLNINIGNEEQKRESKNIKVSKRQAGKKRGVPDKKLDTSISRLPLIYQLAKDAEKIEFSTQMLALIEQEESLEGEDKATLHSVFDSAIAEYSNSLTDLTADPNKFTPLLRLINTILKLNGEAERYISGLNNILNDFKKIKDKGNELVIFNAYIGELQKVLSRSVAGDTLDKRFSDFTALTVKKGIDDIANSQECKELKRYEHETQGWTMWLLTFIGLHDKGHDITDFFKLLTTQAVDDKLVFFQTIQTIALENNGLRLMSEKPTEEECRNLDANKLYLYEDEQKKLKYVVKGSQEEHNMGDLKKEDTSAIQSLFRKQPLPEETLYISDSLRGNQKKALQLIFDMASKRGHLPKKKDESKVEADRKSEVPDLTIALQDFSRESKQERKEHKKVNEWQKKLTKIRNPIYQIYQFFGGTVDTKSTTEQKIIELYEKKKDAIDDVLKRLPKY